MPKQRENASAHELIGTEIEVKSSSDATLTGLVGIVRDETKNTLKVEIGGREKVIPKPKTVFELEDGQLVDGAKLALRPEDRVKRRLRRRS